MELSKVISSHVIAVIVNTVILMAWLYFAISGITSVETLSAMVVYCIGFIGIFIAVLAGFFWLRDSLLEIIETEKQFD